MPCGSIRRRRRRCPHSCGRPVVGRSSQDSRAVRRRRRAARISRADCRFPIGSDPAKSACGCACRWTTGCDPFATSSRMCPARVRPIAACCSARTTTRGRSAASTGHRHGGAPRARPRAGCAAPERLATAAARSRWHSGTQKNSD